ncbi:MAG: hypothetical protein U0O25_00055 [Succinivibrio sp.]|uniref:UPF0149 family protein n=1 Tax=Succinivibrio sp. TaxID=2053619 RepID=UPI00258ECACC|nr:UPF0149 family protein [Succinivibrio sp.]MCI6939333.1 hypothetical protein [Succinatimonas hippei]MDD6205280.1 hypothetical protein [Succinivibrio sp.]
MTVKNGTYTKVLNDLNKAGITTTPFVWTSLMIGMMSKGVEAGSRIFINSFSSLLNDNQPLPGEIIAVLTNLGMDLKEKIEKGDEDLFSMPDSSFDKKLRLQTLADLSYGFALGLTVNSEDGSLEKIKDKEMLADLATISEVAKVDIEAELDEEDLDNVLGFMIDVAQKNYALNQK